MLPPELGIGAAASSARKMGSPHPGPRMADNLPVVEASIESPEPVIGAAVRAADGLGTSLGHDQWHYNTRLRWVLYVQRDAIVRDHRVRNLADAFGNLLQLPLPGLHVTLTHADPFVQGAEVEILRSSEAVLERHTPRWLDRLEWTARSGQSSQERKAQALAGLFERRPEAAREILLEMPSESRRSVLVGVLGLLSEYHDALPWACEEAITLFEPPYPRLTNKAFFPALAKMGKAAELQALVDLIVEQNALDDLLNTARSIAGGDRVVIDGIRQLDRPDHVIGKLLSHQLYDDMYENDWCPGEPVSTENIIGLMTRELPAPSLRRLEHVLACSFDDDWGRTHLQEVKTHLRLRTFVPSAPAMLPP